MLTTLKTYSFLALVGLSLLFTACNPDPDESSTTFRYAATLNGQPWAAQAHEIKATHKNGQFRITRDFCEMGLFFDGDTPGNYTTGRDQYNFAIAQDENCGEVFYSNLEELNTGVLEITSVDQAKKLISGKFSFTATSRSGATLTVQDGVFENIPYTDEAGNSDNKPVRGWIEEDGKRYALNNANFTNYQFNGSTSSQHKSLTLFFLSTPFLAGTYDLEVLGSGNYPSLVYNLAHDVLSGSRYNPEAGSQLNTTLPVGSVTSFLGSFEIDVLKEAGTGPDAIHLKSEFEVYQ